MASIANEQNGTDNQVVNVKYNKSVSITVRNATKEERTHRTSP